MADLAASEYQRLIAAVKEAGGVDALTPNPRRRGKVAFKSADEVLDAKVNGLITRAEARRLLAIPTIRPARRGK